MSIAIHHNGNELLVLDTKKNSVLSDITYVSGEFPGGHARGFVVKLHPSLFQEKKAVNDVAAAWKAFTKSLPPMADVGFRIMSR